MDGVAKDWFTYDHLGDGVYLIEEPHVSINVRGNIWLVTGRDKSMIVDSGMGVVPLAPVIEALTDKPVICVSTHAHFDHVGGAHEFEERISHPAEADILANPTAYNTVYEDFIDEETFTQAPRSGFRPSDYHVKPCAPTRAVEEGDFVDLGDRQFEVLHLPGHSPGSICLLDRRAGTLFSGDVIYQGELFDHLYHSNPETYCETMARVKELPASLVHAGHYESFGKDRMRDLADDYIAGRRKPGCPASS